MYGISFLGLSFFSTARALSYAYPPILAVAPENSNWTELVLSKLKHSDSEATNYLTCEKGSWAFTFGKS